MGSVFSSSLATSELDLLCFSPSAVRPSSLCKTSEGRSGSLDRRECTSFIMLRCVIFSVGSASQWSGNSRKRDDVYFPIVYFDRFASPYSVRRLSTFFFEIRADFFTQKISSPPCGLPLPSLPLMTSRQTPLHVDGFFGGPFSR